jgi:dTDP-4-dehydrorhamnose reductase
MALSAEKVLVTGGYGMLASDLVPILLESNANVQVTDKLSPHKKAKNLIPLDITNYRQVEDAISDFKPKWVVNCAAFTDVDEAETRRELAFLVNGTGAGNLAKACARNGAKLLHISTDYVFGSPGSDNINNVPYTEEMTPRPCGVYGESKRYGEELVSEALPTGALIVRTSWLHGVYGKNFLATIYRLAKERDEIKVVNDQIGSPTWAPWLASMLVKLMERNASGIFHVTSRGDISWYDFAMEIISQAGLGTKLLPQTTEELARPAPRPSFSTLDVSKVEAFLGEKCISWKQGVAAHLRYFTELNAAANG